MASSVPTVRLNNGLEMPRLGLGLFQVTPDNTPVIAEAIRMGYRSLDTAPIYGNQPVVRDAIARSGVPRQDLFVTSKVWNSDHGYESTLAAFEDVLAALGLDYLDLYLIHWPAPAQDRYLETWRALRTLLADGRVRAIGVSNFDTDHLRRLLDSDGVVPAVNQIELHPFLPQHALRELHAGHGITTMAWSPLAGHQPGAVAELLGHPVIAALAARHGRTPAQIVLRWHLQLGNTVIPKSVTPERLRRNLDVFDFDLSADDMSSMARLDSGRRLGPHPNAVN
jgi:2,5-diketo-D-gluconate reductase A